MSFKVTCLYLLVVSTFASYISEPYQEDPGKYDFNYGIKDDYSGNDFGHQETRDGYSTSGQYQVALPDGRIQVVAYTADKNGYVAQVTYEGEATYPDHKHYEPTPYEHEPAPYHHQPTPYKPSLYKPLYAKSHHLARYHPHPAPYHLHPAPYYPHTAPYVLQPAPYQAKPEAAEDSVESSEDVSEESAE